jgi:hypothetical protein
VPGFLCYPENIFQSPWRNGQRTWLRTRGL